MGLIDRFTRDEVSAKVWWPVALLFVVIVVASFRLENMAEDDRRTEASVWASAAIAGVVEPALPEPGVARPFDEGASRDLTTELAPILANGSVSAVRVWTSDGTLAYSSTGGEPIGSQIALNDGALRAALGDPDTPVTLIGLRSPAGEPSEPLLQTYLTVGDQASTVAEVQMTGSVLLADVSSSWLRSRLLFAVAAILTFGLAMLSMREPVAPIGAGVRFYPESLPDSMVAVDRREAALLQERGHGHRGSEALERRIGELEASKFELEGELQRALSALATLRAAKGVTPGAIPGPAAPFSVESGEPRPKVVRSAGPAQESAAEADVDLAPMEPLLIPEPAASEPPSSEPADEVEPGNRAEPAQPEVVVLPEAEPGSDLEPEPEPEPVVAADAALPALDGTLEVPDTPEPLLDLIVLPEVEPDPASERRPAPASEPGGDHEAVDVLNRLVTPVEAERPAADTGDIRARLARTAALKKPGSRERREEAERRSREKDEGPA